MIKIHDVTGVEEHFRVNNGLKEYLVKAVGEVRSSIGGQNHKFRTYNYRLITCKLAIEHYLATYSKQHDEFDLGAALEKLDHTVNLLSRKAASQFEVDLTPSDITRHLMGERKLQLASRATTLLKDQYHPDIRKQRQHDRGH